MVRNILSFTAWYTMHSSVETNAFNIHRVPTSTPSPASYASTMDTYHQGEGLVH